MTTDTIPQLEDEDAILAFTHSKRKDVVLKITTNGIPNDNETVKMLLTTLSDMDKSALGRKRIKVEEKLNTDQAAAAGLIAKMLSASTMFQIKPGAVLKDIPAPKLGNEIPEPILVEGETSTNTTNETFETFSARMSALED
jgi:hypothetical protein